MRQIMVICAHPDDEIFGPGATMAKYAEEGDQIYFVVLSFGESSHMWYKRNAAAKMRAIEATRAAKYVGAQKSIFIGLKEGNFEDEYFLNPNIKKYLRSLIKKYSPEVIFTHSPDDPHPDHKSTYKIIMDLTKKSKADIYTFSVWNPYNIRTNAYPQLVVDVTKTFEKKVNALKMHKSQMLSFYSLIPGVYIRARLAGRIIGAKYAEVFYKVK